MIPLIHDMSGKGVIIFGRGRVAFRKAAFFHPESEVTVIGRNIDKDITALGVSLIRDEVTPDRNRILKYIRGLNNIIGDICRENGILFNNADGEAGNVIVPSVVRGENYLVAISTEGKSPAVPRYVRHILEKECGGLDDMIDIQSEVRETLKATVEDQRERNRILREIVEDEEVWRHLETDKKAAMKYINGKYLR